MDGFCDIVYHCRVCELGMRKTKVSGITLFFRVYDILKTVAGSVPGRHDGQILGWVTVFRRSNNLSKSPRPTQPPTLSETGNKCHPKCDDALRLGSKGRYGLFYLWINVWVAGKTV